ncbi:MAG: hypothetical protein R3F59_34190 [Myxococcota bacterium]
MLDRRSFTFGSLLALGGTAAAAEPPIPELQQAPPAARLRATWALAERGERLLATLTLHNDGREPIDVMVARGSLPGPFVQATVDGEPLTMDLSKAKRRDLMSRVGPVPRFEAIAAGGEAKVGFAFALAAPLDGRPVDLLLMVSYGEDWAEWQDEQRVSVGSPAA